MANHFMILNDYDFAKAINAIENNNKTKFERIMKKFIRECGGLSGVNYNWSLFEDFNEIKEVFQDELETGDFYVVDLITFEVFKITSTIVVSSPQIINF